MRLASVGGLLAASALLVVPTGGHARAQLPVLDGPPLCGTEAGAGDPSADDLALRVATYNILHTQEDVADETLDRRLELVAADLDRSSADVIGLQEVVRSANHGVVAQRIASSLAASTGHDWAWCFYQSNPHVLGEADTEPGGAGGPASQQIAELARAGDAPWAEGVAILSRFPIADQRAHRLPPRTAEVPFCVLEHPDDPLAGPTCELDTRTLVWARVAAPCGDVDLFTSHLANDQSSMSEQIRLLQVGDALSTIDQLAADGEPPDLYVGDFNTLEGGQVWQAIVDAGFVDAYRAAEPSAPGLTSDQDIEAPGPTVTARIDYVMVRAGSRPLVLADAEILGDQPAPIAPGDPRVVWPSDHYGVAVTLGACAPPGGPAPGPTGESTSEVDAVAAPAAGASGTLPATGNSPAAAGPAVAVLLAVALTARRLGEPGRVGRDGRGATT